MIRSYIEIIDSMAFTPNSPRRGPPLRLGSSVNSEINVPQNPRFPGHAENLSLQCVLQIATLRENGEEVRGP